MTLDLGIDVSSLPTDVREKLAELELELSEGDITQKGYEKKRSRLLAPYITCHQNQSGAASPSTRAKRRAHRRLTRHESRYHSEVRQEAVQQALAAMQKKPKPSLPMPSKRTSVMATSPNRDRKRVTDSSSDDDSILNDSSSTTPEHDKNLRPFSVGQSITSSDTSNTSSPAHEVQVPPPRIIAVQEHSNALAAQQISRNQHRRKHQHSQPPLPPHQQQILKQQLINARISRENGSSNNTNNSNNSSNNSNKNNINSNINNMNINNSNNRDNLPINDYANNIPPTRPERISSRTDSGIVNLADVMQNLTPSTTYNAQPDVTSNAQSIRDSRDLQSDFSIYFEGLDTYSTGTGTGRWKVSAKIQQLLNTLKRPKRRPLPEYYVDDETDLEIAANQLDPTAPKPEGSTMMPAIGEQLMVPGGLPKTLEAALHRYGSATFKAPAATVLDTNSKISPPLTYGKLLSRSRKIAYNLLNKIGNKGELSIKPGDRVALIFPNNDPIGFMSAYYGCLTAGVVPVAIEVPLTRRDAGSQQIGFLLGSCNVAFALTSEACHKGLPKTATGEIHTFKGWPKLSWLIIDTLGKPPKDWSPPSRISEEAPAYIEYSVDRDGAMKGVTVSRNAMISHCRALTGSCNYTEGEIMICVLDFKREVGLWHSILCSVLNGMHVIFIPYALMKINPASWMLVITKYKASVAICKSRDLHWGLLATKDHKDVNLSSLRMLLVADGSNPWSLSSCDQFLNVFHSRGLRVEAMCPCAVSAEALTISVRRPGRTGIGSTGRGVLSMSALSYGVIRVDQENSLTSLTLQDCGHVLPGAIAAVVKINGPPHLCKTDEVGEICLSTTAAGSNYWGLQGLTNSIFRMQPLNSDGHPFSEQTFVRTGLLGFMGPGALVFVCGTRDGVMTVSGRKHNTDDLIATVLAVEPMKFVYRGRIAIFAIKVLRDERICVIAEQRPDCTEEESFQWMSRVLQAVDSIHQVGIYCLALVPPNCLPKTPLGGIHLSEVKRRFLEGALHPANVLMCPHTCVTNLPKPREVHTEIGPASVMVGNIVQGVRLAVAQGRDVGSIEEDSDTTRKYQFISEILKWRATTSPDHNIHTLLNSKGGETQTLSCSQLFKRAERVACLLLERGKLNTGDHVALIYSPGIDLICAFYGCLFIGVVPVTIRPPHPQNLQTTLPTVRMIVDVSKSVLILSTGPVIKLLKSKEAGNVVDIKGWPQTIDTDDLPKKKLTSIYRAPTPEMIAYLDFSVSTTGMLAGIKISHAAATSLCRSMKLACELYPSRHIALCLDSYSGLGFVLWCLNSVYSGHHSILIPPSEVELNPSLWLTTVSQYKVRDTFCSYGVMELCTKGLGSSIQQMKQRGVNLSCVRTCVVVAEERPRVSLTNSFTKLFQSLGLSARAVSTSFGCRVNVALCLQGASSPDPTTVYVDTRALRNDRVTLVERGAPHSLCLTESGKLLPGVKVVIANPETKGHCGDSNLGEIWVQSPQNSSGYFTIYGDDSLHNDHFNARLITGDSSQSYARTGYLGFLRRTESVQADGELHDAIFVVGSLDETITLRGLRYHPIDIENSVMRSHKKISECAVFTWTNLLVVVVELDGQENEALDLVPLVTNVVLEEHHLIVGVVVVVDPGVVPINSRGEKQRMHLRDGFLADQLDPIYVAYNM
ncbi:disco-interacting protein 2-like [Oppia nitens]|uniref:disco-interacting protein 2-like n=1 Tax=Oppia nitens TaxID=1686743 RepID=UPI0023DA43B1|nr:disco-interacting protein 2-like [Oppia nitens]